MDNQVIRTKPKDSGFFLKGTGIGMPLFFDVCRTLIPKACAEYRASVGWMQILPLRSHLSHIMHAPVVKPKAKVYPFVVAVFSRVRTFWSNSFLSAFQDAQKFFIFSLISSVMDGSSSFFDRSFATSVVASACLLILKIWCNCNPPRFFGILQLGRREDTLRFFHICCSLLYI